MRGYTRPCSKRSRQKTWSFNIMSNFALVTGRSIPISSPHGKRLYQGLHPFFLTALFSLWKCQGKLFFPEAPSEQLKTLTRQPLLLLLSPLLHTNIRPPHTAAPAHSSPLWHWPALSNSDFRVQKSKATCYWALHCLPFSSLLLLLLIASRSFLSFIFHSVHSCTEVVVPDASLHGWRGV